jgi:hypothetical protein
MYLLSPGRHVLKKKLLIFFGHHHNHLPMGQEGNHPEPHHRPIVQERVHNVRRLGDQIFHPVLPPYYLVVIGILIGWVTFGDAFGIWSNIIRILERFQ